MSHVEIWTLAISIILSVTCAVAGVLLVAKKEALISEGLSHAVLPGIIVAYIVLRDQQSPLLILSAAGSGYLMIVIMQLLKKSKLIQSDAALGVTFSTLFSIGIILASLYLKNTPIHAHCIIDGNLATSYQNKIEIFGQKWLPKSFAVMAINLAVLLGFLLLCYKELKLMVFDPVLAKSLGYRPNLMHSIWLAMVAIISVSAFETAGAVLVVALLIAPAATAFLLTKHLGWAFLISGLVAVVAAIAGFYLGLYLDISQTGPIACISGVLFVVALLFAPAGGVLSNKKRNRDTKRKILSECFLHKTNQVLSENPDSAIKLESLCRMMGIDRPLGNRILTDLRTQGLVSGGEESIQPTEKGRKFQTSFLSQ